MASEWKRPESVPFPSVWYEFDGKMVKDGKQRKFWVQDLTDEYKDEVIHHLLTGFVKDEPICKYTGFGDEITLQESKAVWEHTFEQKLAVICLTNDENGKPKLAGFNCLVRSTPEEKKFDFKSKQLQRTIKILDYLSHLRDPFKEFQITEYLSAMGLYVLPEFRGESLGMQILAAREPICKAFGFKATLTVFTSFISQKLAAKCGFQVFSEISYEDLGKVNAELNIEGIQEHTKICKNMYKLY